jgi:hypothetical protein
VTVEAVHRRPSLPYGLGNPGQLGDDLQRSRPPAAPVVTFAAVLADLPATLAHRSRPYPAAAATLAGDTAPREDLPRTAEKPFAEGFEPLSAAVIDNPASALRICHVISI